MSMRRPGIIAAVLCAALFGCSKPETESTATVTFAPGAVAQPAFENATRDFHEALRNDNTEGMMEHVAEDVVIIAREIWNGSVPGPAATALGAGT